MAPVSSFLALPSGTTAPAGVWSSGSMRVRLVGKTGGCRDFSVSNSKMKIKTEAPGFDVIQLCIANILFYKNRMTFRGNARISTTKKFKWTSVLERR